MKRHANKIRDSSHQPPHVGAAFSMPWRAFPPGLSLYPPPILARILEAPRGRRWPGSTLDTRPENRAQIRGSP